MESNVGIGKETTVPIIPGKPLQATTIGSPLYDDGELDNTLSWKDMKSLVKGVRWLVPDWIPHGMLTGIIGDPKSGKSGFALGCLVRSVVMGESWFNNKPNLRGEEFVLYCDTERSAALNVQRAVNWGIPLDRIKTPFADDPLKPINIEDERHIERIFNVICKYKIPLVIVDSFRGAHDGDENNSRVAKPLRNLATVAEATSTAMGIIHHTKKMSVDDVLSANSARGSNAFLAAVRCQLAIDRPDSKSEWRRIQVLGENLGTSPDPIGFRITNKGVILGSVPSKRIKTTKKQSATEWLKSLLNKGPIPSTQIEKEAERQGFTRGTLNRAKAELEIDPIRQGGSNGIWVWKLPS